MIEAERKLREETQTTMFRMIEDIHSKVVNELQQERREREETEENLVKLLEETCLRVEKSITQS